MKYLNQTSELKSWRICGDLASEPERGIVLDRYFNRARPWLLGLRLAILVGVFVGFAGLSVFGSNNIVVNGPLDTWSSGLPTSWSHTVDPNNGVTSTVTSDVGSTGLAGDLSAKINCTAYPAPGNVTSTSHADLYQTGFVLQNGATYKISFWAKGGLNNQTARVAIFNKATWTYSPLYQYITLGTTWQHFILYFTATQDIDATASLLWFTLDQVGTLWLDDVAIYDGGLSSNASFESWTAGLPTGWSHTTDPSNGVISTVTQDTGKVGALSAKINCTVYPLPGHATSTSHADLYQRGIALTKGIPYTVSFWAKGDATNPTARILIFDTSTWVFNPLNQNVTLGTTWQLYTYTITPTQDIAASNDLLWFTLDQVGTVWLDNLQVSVAQSNFVPSIASIGSKNLIPNSSFEAGSGGWGTLGLTAGWGGNPVGLKGTIDTTSPFEGSSSLRIDLGSGQTNTIYYDVWPSTVQTQPLVQAANLGWVQIDPSQPVTLSAYLRANQANVPVRLSLRSGTDPTAGDTPNLCYSVVTVGTTWQRYTFTCNVPTTQAYIAVGPDLTSNPTGSASVWVDAVQLEQGSSASAYQRREPVEVGITSTAFGNIFSATQTPTFSIGGSNSNTSSTSITITVQLTDYFGTTLTPQTVNLSIGANSSAQTTFTPVIPKKGYYRVNFSWTANGSGHSQDMVMAYVDSFNGTDSPYGINHAPGTGGLCQALRKAGVTWARDWSLVWGNLESTMGNLTFTAADQQIQRDLAENLNVVALIPLPSTNWSSAAPSQVQPYQAPTYAPWARMSYAPTNSSQLTSFAQSAINHYAGLTPGKLKYWEFLNEPIWTGFCLPDASHNLPAPSYIPTDYVNLLKLAYPAMKASDPSINVIGGISAEPWRFTTDFINAGGLNYIDVLNLHNYGLLTAPETYLSQMDALLSQMGANAKPIWMTEFAYYGADDFPWLPWNPPPGQWAPNLLLANERQAADWTIRNNVIMLARGVKKIFYHSGAYGEVNNGDWTLEFPLITGLNNQGQPRKLYAAQAESVNFLGSQPTYTADFSKPTTVNGRSTSGIYGYAFQCGSNAVMVVWADETTPYSWGLTLPSGAQLYDLMGNNLNTLTGRLGVSPIYIVSNSMNAGALSTAGVLGP